MRYQDITSTQEGPNLTDYNGELDEKVLTCSGCKHLGIHDRHFLYCAALPIAGQDYPWPGAGRRITTQPLPECPHPIKQEEQK